MCADGTLADMDPVKISWPEPIEPARGPARQVVGECQRRPVGHLSSSRCGLMASPARVVCVEVAEDQDSPC